VKHRKRAPKPLTAEDLREQLFYHHETGLFFWRHGSEKRRSTPISTRDNRGYVKVRVNGRLYSAHRLAWLYMTGKWPLYQIDHIDLDKGNNAWSNLRKATGSQNQYNRPRTRRNKTGFKGVHFAANGYVAAIRYDGKQYTLGTFATAEEAFAVYCEAARKHHKSYARTT